MEESDNYYLYKEIERKEFLFRIFQHFCLGGSLNQYEDNIEPYFLIAKTLYKDLICVRKTGTQKKITIMSKVYKVTVFVIPPTPVADISFLAKIVHALVSYEYLDFLRDFLSFL
ncbi:UNVERIFIED_CONTAM: hypothetical protein NCL1_31351 [Trichonephila clavipes]